MCKIDELDMRSSVQLTDSRLLPANPLNHTYEGRSQEAVFSSSWVFCSGGEELRSRPQILAGRYRRQSSNRVRFSLSHFPFRRTSWKPIGPPAVPKPFCGNAPFVSRIRSSATGTAASRHTTSITIGLISAAAGVPVAGRPLRSCRGFLCLIHTTAYWLVARHCGGALRSTTAGNRPRRRSKTQTACPILRRSAVGRAVWTAPNRRFRFSAKRSPASITG